jgi:hypothetical protein
MASARVVSVVRVVIPVTIVIAIIFTVIAVIITVVAIVITVVVAIIITVFVAIVIAVVPIIVAAPTPAPVVIVSVDTIMRVHKIAVAIADLNTRAPVFKHTNGFGLLLDDTSRGTIIDDFYLLRTLDRLDLGLRRAVFDLDTVKTLFGELSDNAVREALGIGTAGQKHKRRKYGKGIAFHWFIHCLIAKTAPLKQAPRPFQTTDDQ